MGWVRSGRYCRNLRKYNVMRKTTTSERDVREHVLQPFPGALVVRWPEELVDRLRRVLGVRGGGGVRPEHPVHAFPELDHALRHHVTRTVWELFRPDKCAHVRPGGRRVAHHAAHRWHALATCFAHRLVELVWRHVVADHVSGRRWLVGLSAAETLGHLVGGSLPPNPLEIVRNQQLGYGPGQHLRPIQTTSVRMRVFCGTLGQHLPLGTKGAGVIWTLGIRTAIFKIQILNSARSISCRINAVLKSGFNFYPNKYLISHSFTVIHEFQCKI